ncbi:nucleotidyltransferase domain-containing protein [Myxococcota bacterium]|nr:nucleotidyltransferase domain-containing protein [Myxococcota bacterium]
MEHSSAEPPGGLTAAQWRVGERVLDEESAKRRHLVVSLSGAHAYGFPSPDSDLDLKAVHVEPASRLLSLSPPRPAFERMEVIEGVEIDYTSNELTGVLAGVLSGNGNYAERLLATIALRADPELEGLAPLVRASLSANVHRHYRGFATSQLEAVLASETVPAKKVLYVLRTTLTGAHLLLTGEVDPDLTRLAEPHGFTDALALVERKKAGERVPLSAADTLHWRSQLGRAFDYLDAALERTVLPREPAPRAPLEAWLVELRRRFF